MTTETDLLRKRDLHAPLISSEMNARLSQEMDSIVDPMPSQITGVINSVVNDRVLCEIQNLNGIEPVTSLNEDGIDNVCKKANMHITKQTQGPCAILGDLREDTDLTPYIVTRIKGP